MDKKQIGAIIAIVAGVLIVIGSIGPWVTADLGILGTVSKYGTDGDGMFTLILGLATVVLAGLSFKFSPKGLGIATTVAATLATLVIVIDFSRAAVLMADMPLVAKSAIGFGWGIYLTLIGSLGALAGGAMLTIFAFMKGGSTPAKKK